MKLVPENERFNKLVPECAEDVQLLHDIGVHILGRLGLIEERPLPLPLPAGVVYSTDPRYARTEDSSCSE